MALHRYRGIFSLILCLSLASLFIFLSLSWSKLFIVTVNSTMTMAINVWESKSKTVKYTQLFDSRHLSQAKGYSYFSNLAKEGKINFHVVEQFQLPTQWLSDVDLDVLREHFVADLETVATAATSSLYVYYGTNKTVGDQLTVRVDLRDAKGRLVHRGGHEVRVWMLSTPDRFKRTEPKAATGNVTDLGNGSYAASLPILWPGKTTVEAALMRPREFRGVMLRLLDKMKALFQIMAAFVRDNTEQVTLCLSIPVVPGYPSVCNMTSLNDGLPWYCGKPSKGNLTCADWVQTRSTAFPLEFPVSMQEMELFQYYFTRDNMIYRLHQTHTFIAGGGTLQMPLMPCANRSPRESWNDNSPRGFWVKQKWIHLKCSLPELTVPWIDNCLRDTTMLLLGDSNLRMMLEALEKMWHCKKICKSQYHEPVHCKKTSSNTNITWYPHAYPFFSRDFWTLHLSKHAPNYYMNAIPNTGKYVVVLHLYAHFLVIHSYIFGLHIQAAARGVRDLLSRNPSALVFVRGPHAMAGTEKIVIGDFHAERTLRILRQEMGSLMDRVVFLDTWDMTVANENTQVHPNHYTNREIVRLLLGYICPPKG